MMVGKYSPFLSKWAPLIFSKWATLQKVKLQTTPRNSTNHPNYKGVKPMDATDTSSSLLPIFLLPMMPPRPSLKSSVDDNNCFTIHLGSIYANAQTRASKIAVPRSLGRDLWAVQMSYAIAGFPNPTSLVSCFPPE